MVRNFRSGASLSGTDLERNVDGPSVERWKVEPWDVEPELPVAWSRQRAEAWRRDQPTTSPWRVVGAQMLAGLACAAVAAVIQPRTGAGASVVASALWGAATAVLPSALLARGMTRPVRNPMAAAAGFMFWIMLKIGVAIAMLAIAGRVVPNVSWPALLATLVVCIKINWVALLGRGRRPGRPAAKA